MLKVCIPKEEGEGSGAAAASSVAWVYVLHVQREQQRQMAACPWYESCDTYRHKSSGAEQRTFRCAASAGGGPLQRPQYWTLDTWLEGPKVRDGPSEPCNARCSTFLYTSIVCTYGTLTRPVYYRRRPHSAARQVAA